VSGTEGFRIVPWTFFLLDHGVCQKTVLENFKILSELQCSNANLAPVILTKAFLVHIQFLWANFDAVLLNGYICCSYGYVHTHLILR
jgi:hypothetical protein